jgi:hypothetical protein
MPKVSKDSAAQVTDHGAAEDRTEELDGYSVSFVTIRQGHDLAPMLKGLPDDRCQCPHWGYVFKGRLIWRFADHEEVSEAGDAFYVGPASIFHRGDGCGPELQPCNFDHGFPFVGRAVIRRSRRCAGFHAPAGVLS